MKRYAIPEMKMPLLDQLRHFSQGRTSWHMPGHAGGRAFGRNFRRRLAALDTTELPGTGDLNQPDGAVAQACLLAAEAFGAGWSRLLTGGSSGALLALLAGTLAEGAMILMPRAVHRAVIAAAVYLNLDVRWIDAEPERSDAAEVGFGQGDVLPRVGVAQIQAALRQNPGCAAVLLTSPDYYGNCQDWSGLADMVHQAGALLLADEAHGAMFAFSRQLPQTALAGGVDGCVQSGHKTLPVLTGGAWLHLSAEAISSGRVDPQRVARAIPLIQTSSPSFPIAASLDYARAILQATGERRIERQIEAACFFARSLPDEVWMRPVCQHAEEPLQDPLRIVLAGYNRQTAGWAAAAAPLLAQSGIDIEFADLGRLVLIPSLWQKPSEWTALKKKLQEISAIWRKLDPAETGAHGQNLLALDQRWRAWLRQPPEAVLSVREALLGRKPVEQIPLSQAIGRVAADVIGPYPPGIPLVWPGEVLSGGLLDFICQVSENGITVNGLSGDRVSVFRESIHQGSEAVV